MQSDRGGGLLHSMIRFPSAFKNQREFLRESSESRESREVRDISLGFPGFQDSSYK